MDSYLSSPSTTQLYCVDSPFVVFRNRGGYTYQPENVLTSSQGLAGFSRSEQYLNMLSLERAKFYQSFVADQPVPSHLLHLTLSSEWSQPSIYSTIQKRLSTMLAVRHGDKPLVIHRSGRYFDELSVRNIETFYPRGATHQSAFTLRLSEGSAIRQIVAAGQSNFNTSSNILASTLAEIYLLSTLSAEEVSPRLNSHGFMLEPLQKWQLPDEVIDLSGSQSHLPTALCLTKRGSVYQWSPSLGMHKVASVDEAEETWSISSCQHPQLALLTSPFHLQLLDLRVGKPTDLLEGYFLAASGCRKRGQEVVVSEEDELMLVDLRCLRSPIQRKPGNKDTFISAYSFDAQDRDILTTYSPWGSTVRLQDLNVSFGKQPSHHLAAASPFSPRSRREWHTLALRRFDDQALTGVTVAAVENGDALVFQQSMVGDVFAQVVSMKSPPAFSSPSVQRSAPVGTCCLVDENTRSWLKISSNEGRRLVGLRASHMVHSADRRLRTAALPSSTFLPVVPEEGLKRFDGLCFRPAILRTDLPRLFSGGVYTFIPAPPSPITEEESEICWESIEPNIRTFVSEFKRTLFEISHFILSSTNQLIGAPLLRSLLLVHNYEESRLPCREELTPGRLQAYYGDGFIMCEETKTGYPEDMTEDIDNQGCYLCSCKAQVLGDLQHYDCEYRNCWIPHYLAYSTSTTTSRAKRKADDDLVENGIIHAELCDLLSMEWDMDDEN
eukprot:scaffold4203_cov166-Ochromonas_danica.AAC.17